MFLLLSRNNPYLEELNGNSNNQMAQKDLEGIEIDLKNRFKDQEKNFKMRHYHENSLESQDELISEDEDSNDNSSANNSSSLISLNSDSKIKNIKEENKIAAVNKEEQEKLDKLRHLKNLGKLMDLIGTIILLMTHVLSQFEDDEYYNYNKELRISGSLLINHLYTNTGNITWSKVFNEKDINLRKFFHYCLENENKSMHTNYPKKIREYMARNNFTNFHDLTNLQILEANGITPSTFGMENENNLVYSNFRIKLELSKTANNLRIINLVLTIIGFLLYFSSWYLQYFKDEKLENELLSSKKENQEDKEETKNNENSVANINNNDIQKIKRFYIFGFNGLSKRISYFYN